MKFLTLLLLTTPFLAHGDGHKGCSTTEDCDDGRGGLGICVHPVTALTRRRLFGGINGAPTGKCVPINPCFESCGAWDGVKQQVAFDPLMMTEQAATCNVLDALKSCLTTSCLGYDNAIADFNSRYHLACDFEEICDFSGSQTDSSSFICRDDTCRADLMQYFSSAMLSSGLSAAIVSQQLEYMVNQVRTECNNCPCSYNQIGTGSEEGSCPLINHICPEYLLAPFGAPNATKCDNIYPTLNFIVPHYKKELCDVPGNVCDLDDAKMSVWTCYCNSGSVGMSQSEQDMVFCPDNNPEYYEECRDLMIHTFGDRPYSETWEDVYVGTLAAKYCIVTP